VRRRPRIGRIGLHASAEHARDDDHGDGQRPRLGARHSASTLISATLTLANGALPPVPAV
jgi:hypothetical protein